MPPKKVRTRHIPSRAAGALVYPWKAFTEERRDALFPPSKYEEIPADIQGVKRKLWIFKNEKYHVHKMLTEVVQAVLDEKLKGVAEKRIIVFPMTKNKDLTEEEQMEEITKKEHKEPKTEDEEEEEEEEEEETSEEETEKDKKVTETPEHGLSEDDKKEAEYLDATYKKLLPFANHLLHKEKNPTKLKQDYEEFKRAMELFLERLGAYEAKTGQKYPDDELFRLNTKLITHVTTLPAEPEAPAAAGPSDVDLLRGAPAAPVPLATGTGRVDVPAPTPHKLSPVPAPKGKAAKPTAQYYQKRRYPNDLARFEKYIVKSVAQDYAPMARYYNGLKRFEKYITPVVF